MEHYPDFFDSTDQRSDGPALRTGLDQDGYVFIRGLLPAETILTVRERLLAKAGAGGWLDPDSPAQLASPTGWRHRGQTGPRTDRPIALTAF